jgi:hypothetical protein
MARPYDLLLGNFYPALGRQASDFFFGSHGSEKTALAPPWR